MIVINEAASTAYQAASAHHSRGGGKAEGRRAKRVQRGGEAPRTKKC